MTLLLLAPNCTVFSQLRRSSGYLRPVPSPRRGGEAPDAPGIDIVATARDFYNLHAKGATEALTEFVAALGGNESHLCVTYFDEADELDMQFWVLLCLLGNQDELTAMWYVFMATKSRVTYFAPMNKDCESFKVLKYIHYSSRRSSFPATQR